MPDTLLAIPVFNERDHVVSVIAESRRYVDDIIVVDDGSTDGTSDILRGLPGITAIHHLENRGYGQALLSAFNHAIAGCYDWLITLDCDTQHEPAAIPQFLQAIGRDDADIISGSRYLQPLPGNGNPPPDRRRINRTITCILNELLGTSLTDAFCGFKAYRTSALRRLQIDIPGYAMPLQLWVQAAWLEQRILEVAVPLIYIDPNRHFGGILDDPDSRLAHYLAVLAREMARTRLVDDAPPLDRLETRS